MEKEAEDRERVLPAAIDELIPVVEKAPALQLKCNDADNWES